MRKVYSANPLFKKDMKVSLDSALDGQYVSITTYDRRHGYNGRFLADRDGLQNWYLGGFKDAFLDRDINNFIYMWRQPNGDIRVELNWISEDYEVGDIKGCCQSFDMTTVEFVNVVFKSEGLTKLCWDKYEPAKIDTSGATRVLQTIQKDKKLRRAFSKAVRDQMGWHNTVFHLYPDWRDTDFFFKTDDGISGGLILSDCDDRLKYYVHT